MTPTEHSWFYTPRKRLDLGGLHASSSVWRHLWLEVESRTNSEAQKEAKGKVPSFSVESISFLTLMLTFWITRGLFCRFLAAAIALHKAGWMSEQPQYGHCVARAVEEGLRGTTEQEWKWLVGREVRRGFALTFTLAPQLMLRCCHFHHLKCCHFRCRSLVFAVGSKGGGGGNEGKREEVWEDFHFKQAELCHTVTWLPWQPLFSVSQLPVSSLLLSCVPLFSRLSSSFSRTL